MTLDRVNRDDKSVGDLLIGHATAKTTQHVFFAHGELFERDLLATATQSAVVKHATDQWVEVLPVGVDCSERCSHRAGSGGLSRADSMAVGIDGIQDRARDWSLKQHQHLQIGVDLSRPAREARATAALKSVCAEQQVGSAGMEPQQAVILAGAGSHQRSLSFKPEHPAAEQNTVGGGDSGSTALKQAVTLA